METPLPGVGTFFQLALCKPTCLTRLQTETPDFSNFVVRVFSDSMGKCSNIKLTQTLYPRRQSGTGNNMSVHPNVEIVSGRMGMGLHLVPASRLCRAVQLLVEFRNEPTAACIQLRLIREASVIDINLFSDDRKNVPAAEIAGVNENLHVLNLFNVLSLCIGFRQFTGTVWLMILLSWIITCHIGCPSMTFTSDSLTLFVLKQQAV